MPEVIVELDGSALTRLTNNDAGDYEADWARDGSRSAFSRIVDWPAEVFTMAADGTDRQRIPEFTGDFGASEPYGGRSAVSPARRRRG
jgi:Tol biopolymer transport system component